MTSDSQYPSMLLQRAVTEISKLPGIGQKTALRLALHLLRQETEEVDRMAQSIMDLRHGVRKCRVCRNICDGDTCSICANPARDPSLICVVENVQDVMAVERTLQYRGLYHVLGGVISPMDGIGPANLEIESLVERVSHGDICEVILALSPTMEGSTSIANCSIPKCLCRHLHEEWPRTRNFNIPTRPPWDAPSRHEYPSPDEILIY